MNENVKRLMLEAGYAAPHIAPRAQRLVELIVRECTDLVRDISQEYDGGSTVVNAAKEIKQHFGVSDE